MRVNSLPKNGPSTERPKLGSDRSFGLVMAVAVGIIGGWHLYHHRLWAWGLLFIALAFLIFALTVPSLLAPLNRWWQRLGLIMHAVMTPIIMGILFVGVFVPIGGMMRLLGARPLQLRYRPDQSTYWIGRDSALLSKDSFKNQF